jgi:hypothetical protein
MGGRDSAQISDIVGLYILDCIGRVVEQEQAGLYRDDGLMVIPDSNGPKTCNIHKKIQKVFKHIGFKVDISSNVRSANYLDVTFNLADGSYKPFSKNSKDPSYINVNSNHPKHIIRQIPNSVNTRINNLSANRNTFNRSKQPYDRALRNSGFPNNQQLHYVAKDKNNKVTNRKKNRPRKVVWYNPPYCRLSNINIGKKIIDLVYRCFPEQHPLRKICNKSNLKISYSCCKNMDRIISAHNSIKFQKFLEGEINSQVDIKQPGCNCKKGDICPLNGRCLIENTVYLAELRVEEDPIFKRYYIGISKGPWKDRYYKHTRTFRIEKTDNRTSLSRKFWELKHDRKTPWVSWSTLTTASTPKNFRDACQLCLEEKKNILMFPNQRLLLNQRNEMTSRCPHMRKILTSPLG